MLTKFEEYEIEKAKLGDLDEHQYKIALIEITERLGL